MQIDTEKFINEVKTGTIERLDIMESNLNRVLELMVEGLRKEIENHHKDIAELQIAIAERAKTVKEISGDEIERINARFVVTRKTLVELRDRMGLLLVKENHDQDEQALKARLYSLENDIKGLQSFHNQQLGRNAVWAVVISTGINLAFLLLRFFIK